MIISLIGFFAFAFAGYLFGKLHGAQSYKILIKKIEILKKRNEQFEKENRSLRTELTLLRRANAVKEKREGVKLVEEKKELSIDCSGFAKQFKPMAFSESQLARYASSDHDATELPTKSEVLSAAKSSLPKEGQALINNLQIKFNDLQGQDDQGDDHDSI